MELIDITSRRDAAVLTEPQEADIPTGFMRCAKCQELFDQSEVGDLHNSLSVCSDACGSIVLFRMREGLDRLEEWIPHRNELADMTAIDMNVRMAMLRTGIFAIRNGCTVVER